MEYIYVYMITLLFYCIIYVYGTPNNLEGSLGIRFDPILRTLGVWTYKQTNKLFQKGGPVHSVLLVTEPGVLCIFTITVNSELQRAMIQPTEQVLIKPDISTIEDSVIIIILLNFVTILDQEN